MRGNVEGGAGLEAGGTLVVFAAGGQAAVPALGFELQHGARLKGHPQGAELDAQGRVQRTVIKPPNDRRPWHAADDRLGVGQQCPDRLGPRPAP